MNRSSLADGEWHLMHPATPLLRSWQVLAVVLVFVVQSLGNDVVSGDADFETPHIAGRWLAGGGAVLLLIVLAGVGLAFLSWRSARFRVLDEALELHTGVLFRQQRRARLDRMQAVDVVQPFLARLLGLARLTVEVAGGKESNVALSFLREDDARALRNHLLASAAGLTYEGPHAPEAPERSTLEVPVGRLILSLLVSTPAIIFVAGLLLLGVISVVIGNPGPLLASFAPLLGAAGVLWARFVSGFGFRVADSPDGLRLRYGLLEQRTQTVPPGRVQAVRLSQNLLWRRPGWWTVHVNIAGYGGEDNDSKSGSTLLPVGPKVEAVGVLALVLPDLGVDPGENPWDVVDAGLTGTGPQAGYLTAPRRSRWVDPVSWGRSAVRVTDQALLIRSGRIHRHLDIVPHARTQSLGLSQGPVQRRLRLASFTVHSTAGPVEPVAAHLDASQASELIAVQSFRAEQARKASGPERWMERSEGVQQPGEPA
ncbi:PH domain-containing protein [Kineosporia sp. J2-2]|uniref:PH domain-containing protein n=1 Tax=Kineosporia corallincola TaxID=2835133 RepID=A0ABS5T9F7_9ACTN|nr:PH domain-containing protein [Kineosporia corallincola]MBT0767710.1 PH domain-containing protein [Kineosporia corallincola]